MTEGSLLIAEGSFPTAEGFLLIAEGSSPMAASFEGISISVPASAAKGSAELSSQSSKEMSPWPEVCFTPDNPPVFPVSICQ